MERITIQDFKDLELEDLNYNNRVYTFAYDTELCVLNKLESLKLGKAHRLLNVKKNHLFYIENCDIQDITNSTYDTLGEVLDNGYILVLIETCH